MKIHGGHVIRTLIFYKNTGHHDPPIFCVFIYAPGVVIESTKCRYSISN